MIKDKRIPFEVSVALDKLNAIKYVYERDNEIHEDYVLEKVESAESILNWLRTIANEARKEDDEV